MLQTKRKLKLIAIHGVSELARYLSYPRFQADRDIQDDFETVYENQLGCGFSQSKYFEYIF